MERDRERWDGRHTYADAPRPRAPDAAAAAGLIDQLPATGRLLDVACGTGPVTLWALERGLDAVAIDVSGVAIDTLIRAASSPARLDARRIDLDGGLPDDLGEFELVVCQRFRDRDVLRTLPALVAPGGVLLVTVLSEVGAVQPGPFHAPAGELAALLPVDDGRWTTLTSTEADGEASIVIRRETPASSKVGPRMRAPGGSRT